ncbi:ABC transporter permease, partial [Barnesiella intestinihominis]
AMVSFIPVLVVFSMASGITGGFLIAQFTDIISVSKYIYGLQSFFNEYYIWQAIFKALFFAFVISSVASYYGYKVKGGALEVGQASTDSVVVSSVIVLLLDVVLTQILF